MAEIRILRSTSDVTDAVLRDAEEVCEGWFQDYEGGIDWEEFIDRLGNDYGRHADEPYNIEEYDNPAVRKIQRHVREYRRGV